jgi:hypothetical protein
MVEFVLTCIECLAIQTDILFGCPQLFAVIIQLPSASLVTDAEAEEGEQYHQNKSDQFHNGGGGI